MTKLSTVEESIFAEAVSDLVHRDNLDISLRQLVNETKNKAKSPDFNVTKLQPKKFTIEKNVPIPSARGGRTMKHNMPLDSMNPGDSFLVPLTTTGIKKQGGAVSGAISHYQKATGKKFTRRSVPEGIRIWRIE